MSKYKSASASLRRGQLDKLMSKIKDSNPTCTQCGGTENLSKIAPMKPHKEYYLCSKCKEDILKEQEEMMQEDMEEYHSIVWAGLH